VKDRNGDEPDGKDEGELARMLCLTQNRTEPSLVVYPLDFKSAGPIVDDVRIS
jgi:hypothetical protein